MIYSDVKNEIGKRSADVRHNLCLSRSTRDRFGWAEVMAYVVVGEDF